MAKNHLKRISTPKTWGIERKKTVYVLRPLPGSHSLDMGMSLGIFMKEVFGIAQTRREIRTILHKKSVLVDGKRRKEEAHQVGLFDSVDFPEIGKHYRITLNSKGKIDAIEIEKSQLSQKIAKIVGKAKVGKKTQLNLFDGRNLLVEKDSYKVGDSLLLEIPSQQIKKHLPLGKGVSIFLTGGHHIGHIGKIEGINANRLMYKTENGLLAETHKKYAFVIGDDKPLLSLVKK